MTLLAASVTSPFRDKTIGSGVTLVLRNGALGKKHQIETMVGGVAAIDYDRDGLQDLYFTNGAPQSTLVKSGRVWHNRLYRNLGDWRFEDVTDRAGVAGTGYDFGLAAADYNGDGYPDLFVAGMPQSHLYRNRGDGTFEDVTTKAGVSNRQQWPIAAGWFDYNNDGNPDLFVVNYVRWDPATEPYCGQPDKKIRTYCHPDNYSALPNTLFRNNGDGTFRDVSAETGIASHPGKGMAVAFSDYDSDGDTDIFIGNDTVPSFLFRNDGGRFAEVGVEAGIAMTDDGLSVSAMGSDFRDLDNDGHPDLFLTALANETFPLYRNLGRNGLFQDITYPAQIGKATLGLSGWSTGAFDFDNDGHKDLFTANGDVNDNTEQYSSRTSRQRNTVFWNRKPGKFEAETLGIPGLHRGAAFADFDNDGAVDVVVTRLGETPLLLQNQSAKSNNWIAFSNAPVGTQIKITTEQGQQWNHATTAVGYAGSSTPVVHFGLGKAKQVSEAVITLPGGTKRTLRGPAVNRVLNLNE
ncbi:MAG: CRTAC1 family protein [Bryobacteraceae bacterium]|nr:CRTAC1 family protein [Bryobacteraceae bacterium]